MVLCSNEDLCTSLFMLNDSVFCARAPEDLGTVDILLMIYCGYISCGMNILVIGQT